MTNSFNEMSALITTQKEKLGQYAHELEEAYVSTIRVLAAAIEARDGYTLGHSTRVAELAVELARELGLSAEKVEEIEIACLFHDVGKIKIPDSILHKTGRLDHAQFREMKRHPEYGAEILSKARSLFKYIPAVRHHHEWYDGSGYPDGLEAGTDPRRGRHRLAGRRVRRHDLGPALPRGHEQGASHGHRQGVGRPAVPPGVRPGVLEDPPARGDEHPR